MKIINLQPARENTVYVPGFFELIGTIAIINYIFWKVALNAV